MKKKNIIEYAKKIVAESSGHPKVIGTHWESAMMFTSRKKEQLLLYEKVIDLLAEHIILNGKKNARREEGEIKP